jgi:hypothetical protein
MCRRCNFIQHMVTDTKCKWEETVVVKQFPDHVQTLTLHDWLDSQPTLTLWLSRLQLHTTP